MAGFDELPSKEVGARVTGRPAGDQRSSDGLQCPLCLEPFEADDISFFPCQCEYQVCRFCWHRIRTDENGLCPACRSPYPEDPVNFKPVSSADVEKMRNLRRKANVQRRQQQIDERSALADFRIVARNLIVVMGIPWTKAKDEVLRKPEYFGQFGKIVKIVLKSKRLGCDDSTAKLLATAFITYQKEDGAFRAVCKLDHAEMDGQPIRVTLGTTKYCSYFLRGLVCNRSDCMYMHQAGEEAARFTKEDMEKGRHVEYQQQLIRQYLSKLERQRKEEAIKLNGRGKLVETDRSGTADLKKSGELVTASASEKLGSSWGTSTVEENGTAVNVGMKLTPFSLPVYGQSLIEDPKQPVIHIGHDHHEHQCCAGHCYEASNVLTGLNLSLHQALQISVDADGAEAQAKGRLVSSVDAWRQNLGQADMISPTSSDQSFEALPRRYDFIDHTFPSRHRSSSEISSLNRYGGEPPPPPHWFERCQANMNRSIGDHSQSSLLNFMPPAGAGGGLRDAHSYDSHMGERNVGNFEPLPTYQYMGASSLPAAVQNSYRANDFDPYLRLQELHEPEMTSSSFPSANQWR